MHSTGLEDTSAPGRSSAEEIVASNSLTSPQENKRSSKSVVAEPCELLMSRPSTSSVEEQADSKKRSNKNSNTGGLTGYLIILTPLDRTTRKCKKSLFHKYRKPPKTAASPDASVSQSSGATPKRSFSLRYPTRKQFNTWIQEENEHMEAPRIRSERKETNLKTEQSKPYNLWRALRQHINKRDRKCELATQNGAATECLQVRPKANDAANPSPSQRQRTAVYRENRQPGYYASRRPMYTTARNKSARLESRNSWAGPSGTTEAGRRHSERLAMKRWSDPAQYPFSSSIAKELAEKVSRTTMLSAASKTKPTFSPCITRTSPPRDLLQEAIEGAMRLGDQNTADHV